MSIFIILNSNRVISIRWNSQAWQGFIGKDPQSQVLGVNRYTEIGFMKSTIPKELYKRLDAFYKENKDRDGAWVVEGGDYLSNPGQHLSVEDDGYECAVRRTPTLQMLDIGEGFRNQIAKVRRATYEFK